MRALRPHPQQEKQSAKHDFYEQSRQQDGEGIDHHARFSPPNECEASSVTPLYHAA